MVRKKAPLGGALTLTLPFWILVICLGLEESNVATYPESNRGADNRIRATSPVSIALSAFPALPGPVPPDVAGAVSCDEGSFVAAMYAQNRATQLEAAVCCNFPVSRSGALSLSCHPNNTLTLPCPSQAPSGFQWRNSSDCSALILACQQNCALPSVSLVQLAMPLQFQLLLVTPYTERPCLGDACEEGLVKGPTSILAPSSEDKLLAGAAASVLSIGFTELFLKRETGDTGGHCPRELQVRRGITHAHTGSSQFAHPEPRQRSNANAVCVAHSSYSNVVCVALSFIRWFAKREPKPGAPPTKPSSCSGAWT